MTIIIHHTAVTVRGQAPKRRPSPKPKSIAINTCGGDSVYEVVEGDYDGIPGTLSYQPTNIVYNARTNEVKVDEKKGEPCYDALGPGSEYDYYEPETKLGKLQANSTEDVGGSAQYAYNTRTDEIKLDEEKGEPCYDALGLGSEYDYYEPETKHQANSTEDVGGSAQYKEPTQTKFRVSI